MANEIKLEFVECESCSQKPGSPTLCKSCQHNRAVIQKLVMQKRTQNHDVRMARYGCSGTWIKYKCYTCNDSIDTGQKLFNPEWSEQRKTFLENHPCEEIKDETKYRTVDL